MITLTKLIGVILVAFGVIFILNPKVMKLLMEIVLEGKKIYYVAGIRILFGLILLLAASQCQIIWLIILLGILFLISGSLVLILGLEKSKNIVKTFIEKPVKTLRMLSLILIVIGILILYAA